MKLLRLFLLLGFMLVLRPAAAQTYQITLPRLILTDTPFSITVRSSEGIIDSTTAADYRLRVGGEVIEPVFQAQQATLAAEDVTVSRGGAVAVELLYREAVVAENTTRALPGWISVLPPLLAILVALLFRRVIPALFLGIWLGAWAIKGLSLGGLWSGLLDSFQVYVLSAVADVDHAAIILFSLMIGGMVGIISKNGGTHGIVKKIVTWANTPRRGQLAAGVLGLAIFFDDYANTLVVGNTMRPLTDRLRISREKLAYVVDSTAAPVACLAFVTTWIGYEVGLIGDAVARIEGLSVSAYSVFLNSIPYSFYPILAILFVFAVAHSRRDVGPMYQAEVRARTTGAVLAPDARVDEAAAESPEVAPKPDQPMRALNAVIPILVLVFSVLIGLYVTGTGEDLREIIGSADSYKALMWGSLLGVLAAALLSIGQRILTLDETVEAWYAGLKSMLFAMIILVLAWALSEITEQLHTADFLVSSLSDVLVPGVLPALIFVLAAAVAFATGSSWGTMGILMPLVVPLAWAVLAAEGLHTEEEYFHILYSTVSAVLAGSVWGDHCSPISDTTILSSMASGCDHIDHVRTQLPYAFSVGLVAVLFGTLPTGFGFPWWLSLLICAALLLAGLRFFGRELPDRVPLQETPVPELEDRG